MGRSAHVEHRQAEAGDVVDTNPSGAKAPLLIGEALISRGLITPEQLIEAMEGQEASGSRLGSIMIAAGMVSRLELHKVLAEEWGLPFVDLTAIDLDPKLLERFDPKVLAENGWFPVDARWSDDELRSATVATAEPPTEEFINRIQATVGAPVEVTITTDWDIGHALRAGYRDQLLDDASLGLWRKNRDQSARSVLGANQRIAMIIGFVVTAVLVVLHARMAIVVAIASANLAFIAAVAFKFVVCLVGARRERDEGITDEQVAELDDSSLPFYTVLVPVYKEANIVADLVGNLGDLDYPAEKLEILLLMEEDDPETIEAARAANAPSTMVFLTIPDGLPKTKPKACNIGLFFARGEHIVIYDAEDKPDPDQLKKAVIAFRDGDESLICVQAALNYWNAEENWLTRMFTLEYSFWFDYMLPGLDGLKLPIPLGGTSNHFRTEPLRKLGGWDPYNVTEDADLGIRASAVGLKVGVINSTTFEEANRSAPNWVRQRSRWIKGYLQTMLVHSRRPLALMGETGMVPALAFLLLIGGTPATFLLSPPLMLVFFISFVISAEQISQFFPTWVLWASAFNLLLGNSAMVYVSMMGAFKRARFRLVPWAILNPFYWLLHALASYKALWQLITKPHYWEKTNHGLSVLGPENHDIDEVVGPDSVAA